MLIKTVYSGAVSGWKWSKILLLWRLATSIGRSPHAGHICRKSIVRVTCPSPPVLVPSQQDQCPIVHGPVTGINSLQNATRLSPACVTLPSKAGAAEDGSCLWLTAPTFVYWYLQKRVLSRGRRSHARMFHNSLPVRFY